MIVLSNWYYCTIPQLHLINGNWKTLSSFIKETTGQRYIHRKQSIWYRNWNAVSNGVETQTSHVRSIYMNDSAIYKKRAFVTFVSCCSWQLPFVVRSMYQLAVAMYLAGVHERQQSICMDTIDLHRNVCANEYWLKMLAAYWMSTVQFSVDEHILHIFFEHVICHSGSHRRCRIALVINYRSMFEL